MQSRGSAPVAQLVFESMEISRHPTPKAPSGWGGGGGGGGGGEREGRRERGEETRGVRGYAPWKRTSEASIAKAGTPRTSGGVVGRGGRHEAPKP